MKNVRIGRYMNPLTDFGFKTLLGNEKNKELLIDFLNEILERKNRIVTVQYLPTEHLGNKSEDRKAFFDIYCTSEQEEKFIIEMQVVEQKHFMDRSLFYSTFPIQQQAKKGDWNFELSPLYHISILNFVLYEGEQWINHLSILSEETLQKVTDKLNFIVIELPKFKKSLFSLETKLDGWLYCFRHLGALEVQPKALREEIFKKLFEAAEMNKLNPTEEELYKRSIFQYNDIKLGMEYQFEKGIERGMKKGLYTVANNALKIGLSIEAISELTGLTPEQILKIK